jgi:hypothetical protein
MTPVLASTLAVSIIGTGKGNTNRLQIAAATEEDSNAKKLAMAAPSTPNAGINHMFRVRFTTTASMVNKVSNKVRFASWKATSI